jgi:hypothetical protein
MFREGLVADGDLSVSEAQYLTKVAARQQTTFEYTFDVYRTTKGQEGEDVRCVVRLETWHYKPGNDREFNKQREQGKERSLGRDSELAEKYGYYEIQGLGVTDYHTQQFTAPAGLFRNVNKDLGEKPAGVPALTVRVICVSPTQYVGMARRDLYARLDNTEGTDKLGFALNFFKAAFGLWLLLALVIGLSVVLSSHLSGVITLLVTATLFLCGLSLPFIESVATGKNDGGGPAESSLRMFRNEITGTRLDQSDATTDRAAYFADESFRWTIRRILKVFPDVNPLLLMSDYVAAGFAVSWEQMALSLLYLVGYLLPWFGLGYYAIRWREIAAAT